MGRKYRLGGDPAAEAGRVAQVAAAVAMLRACGKLSFNPYVAGGCRSMYGFEPAGDGSLRFHRAVVDAALPEELERRGLVRWEPWLVGYVAADAPPYVHPSDAAR